MTSAQTHCPAAKAEVMTRYFAVKPPEGGSPTMVIEDRAKAKAVIGIAVARPSISFRQSLPRTFIHCPTARNIAALAKPWLKARKTAPFHAPAAQGWSSDPPPASGKTRNRKPICATVE